MTPVVSLYRWDELPLDKVTEMVARKAIVGARQTLVQSYLKTGAIVPLHSHPDEQMIYVLQGALRVLVGDGETIVHEGEVLAGAGGRHAPGRSARRHVRHDGGYDPRLLRGGLP